MGVARWAYDYYLAEREKAYNEYVKKGKEGSFVFNEGDVRKYINNILKSTTHSWLKEVGSNVMKQGVKAADESYRRYLKGISGKPEFKSRLKRKPNFSMFLRKNILIYAYRCQGA